MIKLKVLKSPDLEKLVPFSFNFDQIKVGSKKSCDIYLKDMAIKKQVLTLKVKDDRVLVTGENSELFYKINGKKISGSKLLRVGDLITIGETQLLLESAKEDWNPITVNFEEKIASAINETPEMKEIFDLLEKEVIIAGKDKDA